MEDFTLFLAWVMLRVDLALIPMAIDNLER